MDNDHIKIKKEMSEEANDHFTWQCSACTCKLVTTTLAQMPAQTEQVFDLSTDSTTLVYICEQCSNKTPILSEVSCNNDFVKKVLFESTKAHHKMYDVTTWDELIRRLQRRYAHQYYPVRFEKSLLLPQIVYLIYFDPVTNETLLTVEAVERKKMLDTPSKTQARSIS